jgi:hypothetical protein
MSDINTGGPAFPYTEANGANSGDVGMTLRDYFAAKAMQAATSGHIGYYGHETNHWQVKDIASYAYEMADAMLEAREA